MSKDSSALPGMRTGPCLPPLADQPGRVQAQAALLPHGAVAGNTASGEDRLHVAAVIHLGGRDRRSRHQANEENANDSHVTSTDVLVQGEGCRQGPSGGQRHARTQYKSDDTAEQ